MSIRNGADTSRPNWIDQADQMADVMKKMMMGFMLPGALLGVIVHRTFAIDDVASLAQATASVGLTTAAITGLVYCITHADGKPVAQENASTSEERRVARDQQRRRSKSASSKSKRPAA